jgi:hypothetical protein
MRQIMALFDEYQSQENAKHVLRALKENARPATTGYFAWACFRYFGPGKACRLAEGVGFEPTVPLQARRFSRPVP